MEKIIFEATHSTPEVIFNPNGNKLSLRGICAPENPRVFFDTIESSIQEVLDDSNKKLIIEIEFEYFNTGSSKRILGFLLNRSKNSSTKSNTKVVWVYEKEDTDLKEAGALMEELSDLEFEYLSK